jgi:hypothetical protein
MPAEDCTLRLAGRAKVPEIPTVEMGKTAASAAIDLSVPIDSARIV